MTEVAEIIILKIVDLIEREFEDLTLNERKEVIAGLRHLLLFLEA